MEGLVAYLSVIGIVLIIGLIFLIIDFKENAREESTLEERRLNPDLNTNTQFFIELV